MKRSEAINLIRRKEYRRFYQTRIWRRVRAEVLEMDKHECQDCKAKGIYTRAAEVHHIKTIYAHPDKALDIYLPDGTRQLISLCFECHRIGRHGYQHKPKVAKSLSDERW